MQCGMMVPIIVEAANKATHHVVRISLHPRLPKIISSLGGSATSKSSTPATCSTMAFCFGCSDSPAANPVAKKAQSKSLEGPPGNPPLMLPIGLVGEGRGSPGSNELMFGKKEQVPDGGQSD
jgi:hypothetical protein